MEVWECVKRNQFTFYYSFYDVISCIDSQQERGEAYDVLCRYALFGEKPDFTGMSLGAKMAVKAFMPTLDAARKKAQSGAIGGSKQKANGKQTESKDKVKVEDKTEVKHTCEADFDRFWELYPRKVKKQQARAAFENVDVDFAVLMKALNRQAADPRWQEEGGRFVPYPDSWLKDRRWEDETQVAEEKKVPMGCGPMGSLEMDSLKMMMQ